jgi:hypothetical protein
MRVDSSDAAASKTTETGVALRIGVVAALVALNFVQSALGIPLVHRLALIVTVVLITIGVVGAFLQKEPRTRSER